MFNLFSTLRKSDAGSTVYAGRSVLGLLSLMSFHQSHAVTSGDCRPARRTERRHLRCRQGADHRQAGQRAVNADRQPQRHAPHGGLRLCPADRLHPGPCSATGHLERRRGRRWPHLHPSSEEGPCLVRRRRLHLGRLSLLVGRCRQQHGAQSNRSAGKASGRRRDAQGRVPGRSHGPLQLVEAQPAFSTRPGRRLAIVHLYAGALSEAIPRSLCQQACARRDGRFGQGKRLGTAAWPTGQSVQIR